MPLQKFNNLSLQIKQFGLHDFVMLKITENHYRRKIKKLGITYSLGRGELHTVNNNSLNKDSRLNECTAYYIIKKGIQVTGLKYHSIELLDIGCGNGKVLTYGMYKKCKQVIGIDLDKEGLGIADKNCTQMNRKGFTTLFKTHYADACEFTIPAGINVIYIANPFGEKTMESVLKNIVRYYNTQKKDLYIIYAVSVHRHIFEQHHQCRKMFEGFNGTKIHPELVVYKIFH